MFKAVTTSYKITSNFTLEIIDIEEVEIEEITPFIKHSLEMKSGQYFWETFNIVVYDGEEVIYDNDFQNKNYSLQVYKTFNGQLKVKSILVNDYSTFTGALTLGQFSLDTNKIDILNVFGNKKALVEIAKSYIEKYPFKSTRAYLGENISAYFSDIYESWKDDDWGSDDWENDDW